MSKQLLPCGHPIECEGMAGTDGNQPGCGWCADIADNAILIDHLSRTYDHFSGGRISKPLTLPEEVFTIANDLATEDAMKQRKETIEECVILVGAECVCYLFDETTGSSAIFSEWGKNDCRHIIEHDSRCPIALAFKLRELEQ